MLHVHVDTNTQNVRIASFDEAKSGVEGIQSCRNWTSKTQVDEIAAKLTKSEGTLFIGIDRGEWVSPRFDVMRAPAVGDAVSKSFNGDTYPVGHVVSISKTMKRITTSTGDVFHRRRESGSWSDGTFSMVQGHISELNPSF